MEQTRDRLARSRGASRTSALTSYGQLEVTSGLPRARSNPSLRVVGQAGVNRHRARSQPGALAPGPLGPPHPTDEAWRPWPRGASRSSRRQPLIVQRLRRRPPGLEWWRRRSGEPALQVVFQVQAGPHLVGVFVGLACIAVGMAGMDLLTEFEPSGPAPVLGVITACCVTSFASGAVVTRLAYSRWTAAVGARPANAMVLGLTDDRLMIWRWRSSRSFEPLLNVSCDGVVASERGSFGLLTIVLPCGKSVALDHDRGPIERAAVQDLISRLSGTQAS
jgi:hypothetical protein